MRAAISRLDLSLWLRRDVLLLSRVEPSEDLVRLDSLMEAVEGELGAGYSLCIRGEVPGSIVRQ